MKVLTRRHREMVSEIAAMRVGDCLQWDVPRDLTRHSMSSVVYQNGPNYFPGMKVRLHFYARRMFIVRIA